MKQCRPHTADSNHFDSKMRLSVVIPGYNTSIAMWRRSVGSVLAALGPDDEVICVDDGSLEPIGQEQLNCGNDPRLKLIVLGKNCGQAEARNRGLSLAQGQYVTFVDSDDEVIAGVYDKCLDTCENKGDDIVVFGVKVVWCHDGLCKIDTLPEEHFGIPSPHAVKKLYDACLLEYPVNKVYRRSFLDARGIRFESGICPGEDTAFNLACLMAGANVSVIPDVGYVYYRMDGTTLSRAYANLRQTLLLRTDLWRKFKDANPGMREVLGAIGEYTEADIVRNEWRNMWRKGSHTPMTERWHFLKTHPNISKGVVALSFLRMCALSLLRQYCYVRLVRRWNIKRLYPTSREFIETPHR